MSRRNTITRLQTKKQAGERITMVTAYDATMARLADEAGVDSLLVGDSLGMVFKGEESTLSVTVDEVIYHTQAVVRGAQKAHVVADLPFMSYQANEDQAMVNAGRLLKEGGAQAVKLEGDYPQLIKRLVKAGVPVMGHLGLTPQSVHAMGGFKVQGREAESAERILEEAKSLEAAGCYAIVLEGIPAELSQAITRTLRIPTIGIGAGAACDGQVLVCYDLLGMYDTFVPSFVKRFAEAGELIRGAFRDYCSEVQSGSFPSEAHSFKAKETLFRPRMVSGD